MIEETTLASKRLTGVPYNCERYTVREKSEEM